MAWPNFAMRGLFLVLVFFLTAARSSGILPADLERLLMDPEDEPVPPGSTRPGPWSHPVSQITDTVAAQPLNLDGSWEDILYRQQAARPGPSNTHTNPAQNFYGPLYQIPDAAAAQHVSLGSSWKGKTVDHQTHVLQPYSLLAQYLGHIQSTEQEDPDLLKSFEAPQYTLQSRIEMLNRVKSRIYQAVDVKILSHSGVISPFEELLSKREIFHYARTSRTSNPRFGMWPLEVSLAPDKKERFLVNQAQTQSEVFVKAHGLEASPNHNNVYLDVWHEIQAKDYQGVYGYIGTIRAPHGFSKLKNRLIPSAIRWRVLRPLSTSMVIASLR